MQTSGVLNLEFDAGGMSIEDWAFRWLGDHDATLTALAIGGQLTWTSLVPVDIWFDSLDGYTYVGVVPEPSATLLLAISGLALFFAGPDGRRRSRKRVV